MLRRRVKFAERTERARRPRTRRRDRCRDEGVHVRRAVAILLAWACRSTTAGSSCGVGTRRERSSEANSRLGLTGCPTTKTQPRKLDPTTMTPR